MAKNSKITVVGVKPSSLAMFEGVLSGVLGLGVALVYSLAGVFKLTASTNSVLAGLALGLTAGVVTIIVLPLVYFAVGWIFGYLHGWIFSAIAQSSGGIELDTKD